jgi:tetratricopeptide (TPR) repeat protein
LFTYKDLGRPGPLWNILDSYLELLEDEDLSFEFGFLQIEFGLIDEGIGNFRALFDRAILRDGVDALLVSNLIEALNRGGLNQESIEVFETLLPKIHVSGQAPALYSNAGNSYLGVERYVDAVKCYERSLSMRDENRCRVLHNLGNCYYGMHDDEKAIKCYTMALEEATTTIEKRMEEYALGNAYFAVGREEEARAFYVRAADRGHLKARDRIRELCKIAGEG